MRVAWISGWGVDPAVMKPLASYFPAGAEHAFIPPTVEVGRSAAESDHVVAWSFGARRVLESVAHGTKVPGRVWLLAPFIDFCSEHGPGTRCSITQVRWLRRWLLREPLAALADFYTRAGLDKALLRTLPYAMDDLLEGLEQLAQPASPALREVAARGLPNGWSAAVGTNDPLLDAAALSQLLPGCRALEGVDHQPAPLFAGLREHS